MHTLTTSFFWIELGSLHAIRGALRLTAIGLGMTVGALVLGLVWSTGALGALSDSLTTHAKASRPRMGRNH